MDFIDRGIDINGKPLPKQAKDALRAQYEKLPEKYWYSFKDGMFNVTVRVDGDSKSYSSKEFSEVYKWVRESFPNAINVYDLETKP